jgi:mannose-6-phosphate isomerase
MAYNKSLNQTSNIVSCEYFSTNILEFDRHIDCDYAMLDSFVIYMCLEGDFVIDYGQEETLQVTMGETILIPAELEIIKLIPAERSKILEVYIP